MAVEASDISLYISMLPGASQLIKIGATTLYFAVYSYRTAWRDVLSPDSFHQVLLHY